MKRAWVDSVALRRFLEILPGTLAWTILIAPFAFAPYFPWQVAFFVLAFHTFWLLKSVNVMRQLISGYFAMSHRMKIDWLARLELLGAAPLLLQRQLAEKASTSWGRWDQRDLEEIQHLDERWSLVKDWRRVRHAIVIAIYNEDLSIIEPSIQGLVDSNYPKDKMIVVVAGEQRKADHFRGIKVALQERFGDAFEALLFFEHVDREDEVQGKGSNIHSAGKKMWSWMESERPDLKPEDVMVTTLDADHIVHPEYFARLTYKYVIDPARAVKTYQPVPLLFNNIWDAPATNRITAMGSSFWQIVEAMRPYRLRTFAAHAQSLSTLLDTDFWSTQTIVEDGHQYWRTYFTYNGECEMVPLFVPIYQDCVMAESWFGHLKSQYLQMRRWAWGISDFPFIIRNYLKQPEIPLGEKVVQVGRYLGGHLSWSTATFLLLFAWSPFVPNPEVKRLAHTLVPYASWLMRFAWIGIFANVWVYFKLLPPRPEHHSRLRYVTMFAQWVLAPVVAVLLTAIPALESQTRLMFGRYLEHFTVTPKFRRAVPNPTYNLEREKAHAES